jgi:hypothetical protein
MTALGYVRRSMGGPRQQQKAPAVGLGTYRGLLPPTTVFWEGRPWREHGKSSTGPRRKVGPGKSG